MRSPRFVVLAIFSVLTLGFLGLFAGCEAPPASKRPSSPRSAGRVVLCPNCLTVGRAIQSDGELARCRSCGKSLLRN